MWFFESFWDLYWKNVLFLASNIVFQWVIVVWSWFLILLNSEIPCFAKIKFLKKGGQRGGRCVDLKWLGGYTKKYEFHLRNASYGFVSCYIWSEQTFGNVARPFAQPFSATPGCPTHFHIRDPSIENARFSCFSWLDSLISEFYTALPPFCPPFFHIRKVHDFPYKFSIYHFLLKCILFAVQTHFLKTH